MAVIGCQVSSCRYQSRQHCTLATIQIVVGQIIDPQIPDALESQVEALSGHSRHGYASEFLDYAEYAGTLSQDTRPGAICYSFAPL
jgi:hypothetical protein